jgi:hypothetical protein
MSHGFLGSHSLLLYVSNSLDKQMQCENILGDHISTTYPRNQ